MFSAGAVQATLGGTFNPAGFMAFDSAMKRSGAMMAASEKQMVASSGRMGKGMAMAGKVGGMALAGGVIAAGVAITKSVGLAADFEQQLSRLKATTGATGAQMKTFKKDAMEAGKATKFSALDAAKAQVELAKGGLKVSQMGGGLKAALALAAAGEMDLAEAAATTVNAMKQFKIPGEQAVHVADALATAANTTTADVQHFAMALTQGGAAAKNAGMSIDETVAILEAFADNSVKGSDAGTSLKAMLTQLAAPTDKQANAAKRLNLELWDQNGQLKSLPQMAKALDGAFGGLTNKQRLAAASTIAGTDGMRGLLALYSSSPAAMQGYLDGLKEEGTAAAVAAEKQDNLRGKIENLKGSLETAGIALGEGLLPGLTTGAEKMTDAINQMAESGDLESMGKSLGTIVESMAEAGPTIAAGFSVASQAIGPMVKAMQMGMVGLLTPVAAAGKIMIGLGKAFNAVSGVVGGPKIDLGGLEGQVKRVDGLIKGMTNSVLGIEKTSPTIKIKGDPAQAVAALKRVQGMGLSAKTMKILASDSSAKSKIKALIALGIPPKTAQLLANNAQALSAVGSTQAAINGLQGKTVNINVITRNSSIGAVQGAVGGSKKNRARGRGPGGSETALTGEGVGPELITDGLRSYVVDEPTLVNLSPEDAVVPFGDPSQSGRALSLMLGLFGIQGYAKGKKAAKKGKARPKDMPVPDAVRFGAVPEDELNTSRDQAREAYQKRKERVRDLDVDIRSQRGKIGEAKTPEAKRKAKRKMADLQRDRRRYSDGGDGLGSLAAMRTKWQDLQKQATVLRQYNREIERLNTQQETERTRMATAAKNGDESGWDAARKKRGGILGTLKERYAKALGLAKPGSNFAAELEGKLAGIDSEIANEEDFAQTLTPAQQAAQEAADRLADTGMTDAERATLDQLQAAQSLASLTTGLEDDQASASATEQFLSGILGAAMSDPSRGGASAIRSLADQVKQARDNVASFAGGRAGNDSADLQAQLDQSREQTRVAQRTSEINASALSVFKGAGDIGSGGPRIVINTLHPGDPDTLRAIGDAAVAGMGYQGSVSSSRTNLGL